jgi:hypothetical protein
MFHPSRFLSSQVPGKRPLGILPSISLFTGQLIHHFEGDNTIRNPSGRGIPFMRGIMVFCKKRCRRKVLSYSVAFQIQLYRRRFSTVFDTNSFLTHV